MIHLFQCFASSSKSICPPKQQFCFHTTFNVLVIVAQSADREAVPVGHPHGIMGSRLCLMLQTVAWGGTGGSFCPSATGHLTVFSFKSSLLEREKNRNRWRCTSVRALQSQFPRRISSVHLIPGAWRGWPVCCF